MKCPKCKQSKGIMWGSDLYKCPICKEFVQVKTTHNTSGD